jgi:hypothetical protein
MPIRSFTPLMTTPEERFNDPRVRRSVRLLNERIRLPSPAKTIFRHFPAKFRLSTPSAPRKTHNSHQINNLHPKNNWRIHPAQPAMIKGVNRKNPAALTPQVFCFRNYGSTQKPISVILSEAKNPCIPHSSAHPETNFVLLSEAKNPCISHSPAHPETNFVILSEAKNPCISHSSAHPETNFRHSERSEEPLHFALARPPKNQFPSF